MTRGWVGAPNERAPSRFHGAVVGLVDRWLSRTRNLAASNENIWLSFSRADLGPTSAQDFFFSFFFQSLELVFSRGVLKASGTARFKLFWQHRVSIVIGLTTSTLRWAFSRYARYFEQPAQPGDHGTLVLGGFFIFRGCTTTLYISIISLAALFL